MNKFIMFCVTALCLIFAHCKKASEFSFGEISNLTVNNNSLPRKGMNLTIMAPKETAKNCSLSLYSIIIGHSEVNGPLGESLIISKIPLGKTGKISLHNDNFNDCDTVSLASFFMDTGRDLIIAQYEPYLKVQNSITIDNFDKSTQEIKGSFDITFIPVGTSEQSRKIYPDTLRFNNARFTVRVQ